MKLDTQLSAGVGSDGVTTAVVARDGTVIALDETGEVKWRAKATSDVSIPPIVGFGVVVVRSGDYRIQAFNAQNGERVWSIQRPGPSLALRAASRMILAEGLIITAIPDAHCDQRDVGRYRLGRCGGRPQGHHGS